MSIDLETFNRINTLYHSGDYQPLLDFIKSKISSGVENTEFYFLMFQCSRKLEQNSNATFYIGKSCELDKENEKYRLWRLIWNSETKANIIADDKKFIKENSLSCLASGYCKLSEYDYKNALEFAQKAASFEDCDRDECLLLKIKALCNLQVSDADINTIYNEVDKCVDQRTKKEFLMLLYKNFKFDLLSKLAKKYTVRYPNTQLALMASNLARKSAQQREKIGGDTPTPNSQASNLSLEEALEKIDSLVGLTKAKQQIRTICKSVEFDKERELKIGKANAGDEKRSYHFVFSGNPGTGKTTVARYFGDILKALGILKQGQFIETDRSGLVGQYIGETAQKTTKVIESAMGGILFIDEAYSLFAGGDNSKDFGKEAIDTLVKALEDHKGEFIVIMAGYKEEMKQLMKSNPGLESRFNKFIDFEDYNEDELVSIAQGMAKTKGYKISDDGLLAFKQLVRAEMVTEKFGNARTVRNIINAATDRKSLNTNIDTATREELTTLYAKDFGVDLNETPESRAQKLLDELDNLIGLDEVKANIKDLINEIKYQKSEEERTGLKEALPSMHMAFLGNPGTGKTTVARLYGKILKEIGVLAKGDMIETTRQDFIGKYQGHTASQTSAKCKDAYGGVLFIDEAYSLCNNNGHDDFGQEAVSALIKEMEDNRDKLVVILAGYSKEMADFFNTNSGIESRITTKITFEDYTPSQLTKIFEGIVNKERKSIDADALKSVEDYFEQLVANKTQNFGNGREARNFYEKVDKMMKRRVVNDSSITGDDKRKFIVADVEEAKK